MPRQMTNCLELNCDKLRVEAGGAQASRARSESERGMVALFSHEKGATMPFAGERLRARDPENARE